MDTRSYVRRDFFAASVISGLGGLALGAAEAQAAAAPYWIYVDTHAGDDANAGSSPGAPKRTIESALNGAAPGVHLQLMSPGYYDVAATIETGDALWIEGPGSLGSFGIDGQPPSVFATAWIRRMFDGDLFHVNGMFGMYNVTVYDDTVGAGRSGAALKMVCELDGSGHLIRRAAWCFLQGVRFTSQDPNGAWERIIDADGTNWRPLSGAGSRDNTFLNCYFFGARTPGETIRIDVGTNWSFVGGGIFGAPTAIPQGIKLLTAPTPSAGGTENVGFVNFSIGGALYSEAKRVTLFGAKVGDGKLGVTITPEAVDNHVDSVVLGTVSNRGATSVVRDRGSIAYVSGRPTEIVCPSTGSSVLGGRVAGEPYDRIQLRGNGSIALGSGTAATDTTLARGGAGLLTARGKLVATAGLGAGNSAPATSPGRVVRKLEVFDASGKSLGFIPVYDDIA